MSSETSAKIEAFLNSTCTCWGHNNTWREWFRDVLLTLLRETESFRGKRPNCNSGWTDDLAAAFAKHIDPGVVESWEEEEGEEGSRRPYEVNNEKFDEVSRLVLNHLIP